MEEEPTDLLDACLECMDKAVEDLEAGGQYSKKDIVGMGITNQRCVWERASLYGSRAPSADALPFCR